MAKMYCETSPAHLGVSRSCTMMRRGIGVLPLCEQTAVTFVKVERVYRIMCDLNQKRTKEKTHEDNKQEESQ